MTSFYGHAPFSASFPQLGTNQGIMAQDIYGQNLPMIMPAEGLGQALQTSSYSPEAGVTPYARGGRVQSSEFPLGGLAEALRAQGQEGDSILAHISPREAAFLAEHFGGDINPETGLPQFDFFSKIWKGVKKVAGPALGAVLGTILTGGNPLGGAIGGGIGGSFGHPNDRVGPVMGGIGGYFGGPALLKGGSALMAGQGLSGIGAGLSSGFGQSTGMLSSGLSSFLNSTGLGSFFGAGGGSSTAASTPFSMNPVSQLASTLASKSATSAGSGGLGSFFGGNMLNNALLATAIGGTLLRREKPQGPQSVGEAMMQAEKHRWRPDQYPDKDSFKPINRKYQGYSKDYRPGFDPEQEAFMEDSPLRFSEGGFLEGLSQGQDDNVPALLSEGEFVIPADVVADLGDGNSKAGAKRLEQMMKEIRRHKNTTRHPPKSKGLGAYFNV